MNQLRNVKTLGLALGLTFFAAMPASNAADEYAPAAYPYYEDARELDHAEAVVAQSRQARSEFQNERFVASNEADYWQELTQLWRTNEVDQLWAAEQVIKEGL